jgi:transporter family-2 protein
VISFPDFTERYYIYRLPLGTKIERKPDLSSSTSLIIIAAIGGISVTLQAQFMGLMDKNIGTLESMFITYGGGALLIGLAMLVSRGGNMAAWQGVPWYALSAGALGLVIVGTIGYSTARLGLVAVMTIIVAAQFITGAVLDHFGFLAADLRPLNLTRISGIGLMLLGTWLVVR